MQGLAALALIKQYWPAVVAGLYLAYVAAAGKSDQIGPAFAALLAAFSASSAHAKIAKLAPPK
jgi:hypothetical protein